jgi:hypothetical protein
MSWSGAEPLSFNVATKSPQVASARDRVDRHRNFVHCMMAADAAALPIAVTVAVHTDVRYD